MQGILWGLAGTVVFGLPMTAWFALSHSAPLPFRTFLVFKATFAAILSLAVAPAIGLFALFSDTRQKLPA